MEKNVSSGHQTLAVR